jgi:PHD/YefM family antitoxin component YafN of YafNO toxin-antitoxin module
MLQGDEVRSASEVRKHWAETLDEVERGAMVTITRREHGPATIVDRRRLFALLERQEELEELVEVYEMLSDPEVKRALEAAEAQIERGEGLSFEEAFGEKL